MRRTTRWFALSVLVLAACGTAVQPGANPTSVPMASTSTTGPGAATLVPAATVPATTVCEAFGGTERVGTTGAIVFSLTGREARVGRHECFERIVLELQGDGPFPSWSVEEVAEGYVDTEGRSLPGRAYLRLWVAAGNTVAAAGPLGYASAWALPPDGTTSGFTALQGVLFGSLGDEKDSSTFTVGLDRARPFRASTLAGPPRIVVDIATFDLVASR